jgi:hypothetical protein
MSSTVHDLQKAILDGQQSLTQLLRQTKLIAAKLNLEQVERWEALELTGFAEDAEGTRVVGAAKFTTFLNAL